MSEVEIYYAKFGHYGIKNKEVMTILVICERAGGQEVNRVKGRSTIQNLGILGRKIKKL